MKFIALLLAIVAIILTIAPCCSLQEEDAYAYEKYQDETHRCSENPDENCFEGCSPFYVCGTCVGFTFISQSLSVLMFQFKPVQHNTAYIGIRLTTIPVKIWQPPKVC